MSNGIERASEKTKVLKQMTEGEKVHGSPEAKQPRQ